MEQEQHRLPVEKTVSRYGFRKASRGLASCLLGTLLLFGSVAYAEQPSLPRDGVSNQLVTQSRITLDYQHAFYSNLTEGEKTSVVKGLPKEAIHGASYIFVYPDEAGKKPQSLPQTGSQALDYAGMALGLSGLVFLVCMATATKKKRYQLVTAFLLAGLGTHATVGAYTASSLAEHNRTISLQAGEALPSPVQVNGYQPIGYILLLPETAAQTDTQTTPSPDTEQAKKEEKETSPTDQTPAPAEKPTLPTEPQQPEPPVTPAPVDPQPSQPLVTEETVTEQVDVHFAIEYVEDASLKRGEQREIRAGQTGQVVISYRVVRENGVEVSRTEVGRQVTPAVSQVIALGTAEEAVAPTTPEKPDAVITEERLITQLELPFNTQYVENPNRPIGAEEVELQPGQAGRIEQTYLVKKADGIEVSRQLESEVRIEPTVRIIEVGTGLVSETVTRRTESIPFEVEIREDATLPAGVEVVEREGVAGEETVTTRTPTLNGQPSGEATETRERTKEPVSKIIRRGTQTQRTEKRTVLQPIAVPEELVQVEDPTAPKGQIRDVEGEAGELAIDYEDTYVNDQLVASRELARRVVKEPIPKKRYVGSKESSTETETSSEVVVLNRFATEYIDDPTIWEDEPLLVLREGQDQTETRETTLTKKDGVVINSETRVVSQTELVNKQIRRGTKTFEERERQETRVIPHTERVEVSPERYVDEPETVRIAGEDGQEVVTITERFNRAGQVIATKRSEPTLVKPAVERVLVRGSKVRTKPVVSINQVMTNEANRTALASLSLSDPTATFISGTAQLYQGDKLIEEYPLTATGTVISDLPLSQLDYYMPYTLKTKVTYDLKTGQGQQTEVQEDTQKFELVLKKIEFKDVDAVSLYKVEGNAEKRLLYLDGIDSNLSNYFVKIHSDKQKEILLPVASITDAEKDGQPVYKVTVSLDELVQDHQGHYLENYSFYVAKASQAEGVYTSFKKLVEAIRGNLAGTYVLGADMTADEVQLTEADKAYISGQFTGQLIGQHDGKRYAIYNLAKPLFETLNKATIRELDLREVAIDSNTSDLAALSKVAQAGSRIADVAVQGSVTGQNNVAGIVARAISGTIVDNTHFTGKLATRKRDYGENLVGGLVALAAHNNTRVVNSSADVTIYVSGSNSTHRTGGLVGIAHTNALVANSYVKGNIYSEKANGQTGGAIGSTWSNTGGRVRNVISAVHVVNGNTLYGDSNYTTANVQSNYIVAGQSSGRKDQWSTEITAEDAAQRVAALSISATVDDSSQLLRGNLYTVDYLAVKQAQADRAIAYANMEKLLPFYNKELIVYYGNQIEITSKLYQTPLIDVVPMIGNRFVTDVHSEKGQINKLLLHYGDQTVGYLTLRYKEDFKNSHISEYTIEGTNLLYTPEQFLSSYDKVISRVTPSLSAVSFDSTEVRQLLNLTTDTNDDKLAYLYLQPTFEAVKADIASQLRKVLTMDKSINAIGKVVEEQLVKKISANPAALLLGLSYFNRWYNVNYGDINTKELTTYKLDFFGNTAESVLDTLIAVGKLGYQDLHAKSNISTYQKALQASSGKQDLFAYLDAYRQLFLPEKSNNQWLKENSKAYIVELTSTVEEARLKQEAAYNQRNNRYSVGVYDKITSDSWEHKNMLLPLLTLSDEQLFIISIMNTISFGGYERYRDRSEDVLKAYVREKVATAAEWQRNHADFWYKVLAPEHKDKMFRSVPNFDGFKYREKNAGAASWRTLLDGSTSIQEFFGPINKWFDNNGSGAYANGSLTHFVHDRMLDQYGTSVYTHEMVHNSDGNVYFEGLGRREGLGAELYALGLLQSPYHVNSSDLTLNTLFVEKDASTTTRLHTANPLERFTSVSDLDSYVRGRFDLLYLLDYLEGASVLKLPTEAKKQWFRKIENTYIKGNNNTDAHAGNVIRRLTDEEAQSLTTFNDLIEKDIINRRQYSDAATLTRNGYYTVGMFSPIYAGLDNPNGAPGDLMFRRIAYELLAAKGFQGGFLPYVSNKLSNEAVEAGSVIFSNWFRKDVGLITDTHVFNHIFNNQYANWDEFKKAMYAERVNKKDLLKPITIQYELRRPNSTKMTTISSFTQLQQMMDEAVAEDLKKVSADRTNHIDPSASWVHVLKSKIYNAYLRDTNDFRDSIFRQGN